MQSQTQPEPVVTAASGLKIAEPAGRGARWLQFFRLTPINQRRWYNFKANRRGYWSLWLFLALFIISMFADVIANDRPIIARYKGEILLPFLIDYPEEKIGGFLATIDYKEEFAREEFKKHGWMIWPPIRYSYATTNKHYPRRKNESGDCLGFPSRMSLSGRPRAVTRLGSSSTRTSRL